MLIDAAIELARSAAPRARSSSACSAWATNTWPARQVLAPMLAKQVARKARKEHYPAPYALIDTWRRSRRRHRSRCWRPNASRWSKLAAHADRAQPDPRVLPAGAAEGPGRQGPRHRARARGRRRRDGRRHRGVVGLQGLRGHAAGPRAALHRRPRSTRAQELFAKKVKDEAKRPAVAARLSGDLAGDGVARRRPGDRGDHRERRGQARAVRAGRAAHEARCAADDQHLVDPADRTARRTSQRPAQFAGLHYFNPVALMPLVEIIRHDAMAPETRAAPGRVLQGDRQAAGAGRGHAGLPGQPRAVPVHAGSGRPRSPKASRAPAIDKAAMKFGMPMGPIELVDTVGLDVAAGVGKRTGAVPRARRFRPRWPTPARSRASAARRTARACTSGRTASRSSRSCRRTTRRPPTSRTA